MSQIHIGLDYRPALLGRTGIGRYVRELVAAQSLIEHEFTLSLYGAFWNKDGSRKLAKPIPNASLFAQRFPGRLTSLLGALKILSVEKFLGDVRLFHHTDYVTLPVRSKCQVATMHDLGFLRDPNWYEAASQAKLKSVTENLIGSASVLCAVSEATKNDILERFPVNEQDVFVTPLGVDEAFFSVSPMPQGPPEILMVGTLEPRKNHMRVLEAFSRLSPRFPDMKLHILGQRGWLDDTLVKELKRLQALGQVSWYERADDTTLMSLMNRSSIVVYPSLWEGFGLPALEGMAAGRAVLTSSLGALGDLAQDGALQVDPYDVDAITDGLAYLLESEQARTSLGALGRKRAQSYSWARCAEQTLKAWRHALRKEES